MSCSGVGSAGGECNIERGILLMRFFDPLPNTRGVTAEFTRWEFELMVNEIRELQDDPHARLLWQLRETLMTRSVVDVERELAMLPLDFLELSQFGALIIKVLERQSPIRDPRIWKELQTRASNKTNLYLYSPKTIRTGEPSEEKLSLHKKPFQNNSHNPCT